MLIGIIIIVIIVIIILAVGGSTQSKTRRKGWHAEYDEYLKSDAWKRKRYVVLRRDNWKCVKCGARATQVHHKRYAKSGIGREPIDWLVSVCRGCHQSRHN